MRKVLIALDNSPAAQKIAETGCGLARAMKARVILLHVVPDPPYYTSLNYSPITGFESQSLSEVAETDASEELKIIAQNYLNKSKLHVGDGMIETVVKKGDFAETILKTAVDLNVDLIVMGTHGRRGLEKLLTGSVAEKVLHHSLVPVFIIPTRTIEEYK